MRALLIGVLMAGMWLAACGAARPSPGGAGPRSAEQCESGWTWDPNEQNGDGTRGGCVPPKSWPVATDCKATETPPTCVLCATNPWAYHNCPDVDGLTSYMYVYRGHYYCCVEPPY